jgi:hypothetical protein
VVAETVKQFQNTNNIKMRKLQYILYLLLVILIGGCKKDNYPGGQVSSFIALFDIRNMYKGEEVTLTKENMFGANSITGWVISDHSGGNLPAGLLVIEDNRRLSQLRGIAIPIGESAANYTSGDSVIIEVEGAVLKEENGLLQLSGISPEQVTKVGSGKKLPINRVRGNQLMADPKKYECVLSVIVKGGYDPYPAPGEVLSGDRIVDDAFGPVPLRTEPSATFANNPAPGLANYYGILFNSKDASGNLKSQFRLRTGNDVVLLSSTVAATPIIITGFNNNPLGGDGNYEYIQCMATKDINFATTPFSLVTSNNAGASTPTGLPVKGWATGGIRSYKFDLTSGTVTKGTYFYVGGTSKMINGAGSTVIPNAQCISPFNYSTTAGKGFGDKTSNLLANSGNSFGIAVFQGTTVTAASVPIDVICISTGGTIYDPGPPAAGYRIGNTDFYDIKNPITQDDQPFFMSGSNTLAFAYTTGAEGQFVMLGGEYSPTLGRWTQVRSQANLLLTATSTLSEIEGLEGATRLK